MMTAAIGSNESGRLNSLLLHGILDTPSEETYDCITKAAAAICETPIALITLVDHNRQWFKSCVGLSVRETSRDAAFCAHAILVPDQLMEVKDAALDERFHDNPLVTGAPNIRFYAGVPLVTRDNLALGTLCVIDQIPRSLTDAQRDALWQLGRAVSSLLEERRNSSAIALAIEKNMQHGTVVTDARLPNLPVVYANQGFETLTQFRRAEVLGVSQPLLQGVDTDLSATQEINQAIIDREEYNATIKSYRRDGTSFWNELSVTPVRNAACEVTHFLHVHRDVTCRYVAEQQLRESHELLGQRVQQRTAELQDSEEKYRELFENADDLIHCISLDGKFLYVNPAAYKATGYTEEELCKLTIFDLIHPDDHGRCRERIKTAMAGEQIGAVEATFVTKGGDLIKVEANVNCQFKDGRPVAARGIFHNITAHVTAAESLQQSKEVAEKAAEVQTRFLAAASHDLRQPLAAIGIYLAVLEQRLAEPKNLEICQIIRQSLDATRELLDALLDISMLQSGAVQANLEEFSPHRLFDELRAGNEPQAASKGLSLKFETPECAVRSDPALLKRILENLIANAIRYTESGVINVRCLDQGDRARIEVEATGLGIAAENLEEIFAEYVQLDNAVRDRRKGLGLGLSIVKHVSRLLDHNVTATSTPGVGSCFLVELPSCKLPAFASHQSDSKISEDTDSNLNLLLVEDNPAIRAATRMLFEGAGHYVHAAKDSDGAFAHLDEGLVPDILISDYRLPGMNGVDIARQVRKLTEDQELPVVLITGDTLVTNITAALQHCEVVHKPVDGRLLLNLLQKLKRRPTPS